MAETNSLLNCRTRKGTGGSNPPFSAKVTKSGTSTRAFLILLFGAGGPSHPTVGGNLHPTQQYPGNDEQDEDDDIQC